MIAHRPLKVDIEFDWWSGDVQIIGPKHRRYFLSEGAALLQVYRVLVMLETDSELGPALPQTLPAARQVLAAVPVDVLSS